MVFWWISFEKEFGLKMWRGFRKPCYFLCLKLAMSKIQSISMYLCLWMHVCICKYKLHKIWNFNIYINTHYICLTKLHEECYHRSFQLKKLWFCVHPLSANWKCFFPQSLNDLFRKCALTLFQVFITGTAILVLFF